MKKKISTQSIIALLVILISAINSSCSNEEPSYNEVSTIKDSYRSEKALTRTLSSDEQILIDRLEMINDSIANMNVTSTSHDYISTRAQLNWSQVLIADSKGFFHGFRKGWKDGKGIFGRITTAFLSASLSAVSFSVSDMLSQTINNPSTPTPQTLELAFSTAWCGTELIKDVSDLKYNNPDLYVTNTDDELKYAVAHNISLNVLDRIEMGELLPGDVVNQVFSKDQITYFNSNSYKYYLWGIPYMIEDDAAIDDFIPNDIYPYEVSIINIYHDGITKLNTNDPVILKSKTMALCKAYINEINNSTTIDSESRSPLITTFYLAPLSLMHWTMKYGN